MLLYMVGKWGGLVYAVLMDAFGYSLVREELGSEMHCGVGGWLGVVVVVVIVVGSEYGGEVEEEREDPLLYLSQATPRVSVNDY